MADRRMPGVDRGPGFTFLLDGEPVDAHEGETVAMAMFAAERAQVRRSARLGAPRGVFCNMGICYDCLVYRDGVALRACMLPAAPGLELTSWGPEEE